VARDYELPPFLAAINREDAERWSSPAPPCSSSVWASRRPSASLSLTAPVSWARITEEPSGAAMTPGRVVQGAELGRGTRVVGPALDGQHALDRGGHQQRGVKRRGGTVEDAEPGQSRHRQHEGVDLAVGELAQPGVDVAAYRWLASTCPCAASTSATARATGPAGLRAAA